MKKSLMLIMFLLLSIRYFYGQQEAMLSQYMYSGLYINPAYSGSRDFSEINGIYRKQWVNFEGAPVTQILSAEGPVKNKNMGWGAILMNDKIGVSCRTDLHLNYAYHLTTGHGYRLAFGIRGGLNYLRANLNELRVWDGQDEIFSVNVKNRWLPNAGAGIYVYGHNFYSGLSCPNMIDYSNLEIGGGQGHVPRLVPHVYFNSGYLFETDSEFKIRPSVLLKFVSAAPVQADLNLMVDLKDKVSLGVSYRTGDGIVAMIQLYITQQWKMGYGYDYPFTKLNNYTYGSHELFLSYKIIKNKESRKSISSF